METHDKMEREINLIELFWSLLLGWRQVICFGIIFSVLFCGMKYIKDSRNYHVLQKAEVEEEKFELAAEEEEQVEEAKKLFARIKDYQNYLDTSVLMQVDPYKKLIVELQYYVESDYTYNYTKDNQGDYTDDIMSLYFNYVKSGEMSKKSDRKYKASITQADFSELCTVSWNGNTMTIMFTWSEKEELDVISEFIKSELSQKELDFQEIGSHKLKLLRESQNVVADVDLAEKRNTISNNIAYMNTQLNNLKSSMSEQQLKRLNIELELENDKDKGIIISPVFSLKYMILGAIVGIVMVCAGMICKMFFTAHFQNPEEIRILYDIRVLGEISCQSQRKRFLSIIDNKILAVKNRKKKKLSIEKQIKLTSTNIVLSCKQQGVEHIYMTGSEYENTDPIILDMLRKELLSQGIQIEEGENIFYDAESLKRGTKIGNMVFVEQVGKSLYNEIFNELNLAREQNNNIFGVVVLV